MPELPEVETVRRGLQPVLEGARIVRIELRRKDLRFPLPENFNEQLKGAKIRSVGRRAKYLLFHTDRKIVVIAHLGMSGSFRIESGGNAVAPGNFRRPRSKLAAHDHVTFHIMDSNNVPARIIYNDPRRFGFMFSCPEGEIEKQPMLASLGIEPMGNEFDANVLCTLLRNRNTTLKAALLNQRLIAGLGNIYACEALWRAGLSPRRPARSIVPKGSRAGIRAIRLASSIRNVLSDAIAAGGSSLRDYRKADGSLGYFQHDFAVYDREGELCKTPQCGGVISKFEQAGRSTFHCPRCQR